MIYVHDLDPFAIQFTETFGLRWYGLAYMAGFLVGYGLLLWAMKKGWCSLNNDQAADLVLLVALSGIAGGRVGYVFLYGWEFFLQDPLYLIKIWEGGMSIHGGITGAVLGMFWFCWKTGADFWKITDIAALGTPPGLFFGRIANFINGELWGRPTSGEWGVIFPQAPGPEVPRHPSQLYEALGEGILLFLLLLWIQTSFRKPGRTSAAFLSGYGLIRYFIEFFRAPDPHLGYSLLGMTRGQIYSAIFIVAGMVMWWYFSRKSHA